jgi:hypothetical protein
MRTLTYILTAIILISCNNNSENKNNMTYQNKLNEAKKYYPFENWREAFNDGLEQYTQENCDKAKKIFDDLILGLINIGEDASEQEKVKLFKAAILETNDLNTECDDGLIETGEREDLCELTDKISIACGLDPKKYGDGEGLASEWREW